MKKGFAKAIFIGAAIGVVYYHLCKKSSCVGVGGNE